MKSATSRLNPRSDQATAKYDEWKWDQSQLSLQPKEGSLKLMYYILRNSIGYLSSHMV